MPATPKSGILETTNTTGTGVYTLAGATAGYRAFSTADNGLQFHYAVRTATQFEVGIGTYTHSSRQLTRDLIVANHSSNTSPVNWGVGTKEVASVLPPERVGMLDVENVWRSQQYFRGNSLWLDADDDTGFTVQSDDQVRYMAGGVEFLNLDFANRQLRVLSNDSSALAGPGLQLFRDSVSPAANDVLGFLQCAGKDSAAATVSYAFLYSLIDSPTAGSASGHFRFEVLSAGVSKRVASLRGGSVTVEANVELLTGGKTARGSNTVGAEILADGSGIFISQDVNPLRLNRKGSNGALVDFRINDASIAVITTLNGTDVLYQAFVGAHISDWHGGQQDSEKFETEGTVVCAAPGYLVAGRERLSLVRVTDRPGDPTVYGVVSGPRQVQRIGTEDRSVLNIAAVGTYGVRCVGPIAAGDLLETAAVRGAACRQGDDIVRAKTLGKALEDSPDDGRPRLVPAAIYAG